MAKVLLITRNISTYSHIQFISALDSANHKTQAVLCGNFVGLPDQRDFDLVIHRDSGVSFDDIDLLLVNSLKDQGVSVINDPHFSELLRGKDKQYLWLLKNDLPHITTHISRGLQELVNFNEADDYILKTIRGNQGRGVMLLRGVDSLRSVIESNFARGDERYIIQPRLSFINEWRILTLNNQVMGAIKKDSPEDFRANAKRAHLTAIKTIDIPKPILILSEKINSLLPIQFLGIDIGMTKDGPVIIEVNTTPGFEAYDLLHETNIAKKFIEAYL